MTAPAPDVVHSEDFLDWEARQPERWERLNGVVRLMVGETLRHNKLCRALANALERRAPSSCAVTSESFKLKIGSDVVYPDVMLICPAPADAAIVTDSAVLVAEIHSPSNTASYQRRKLALYQSAPSLQAVLELAQDAIEATLYLRDGDRWVVQLYFGPEAALPLPGCAEPLILGEVYQGFEPPPEPTP